MFEHDQTQQRGDDEMGNHRDNNRVRSIEPEILDNPNINGPSPSGLAMTLASQGKFPELMSKFEGQISVLLSRMETACEQATQATTARVVAAEQYAAEQSARYEEFVKWLRKNGS